MCNAHRPAAVSLAARGSCHPAHMSVNSIVPHLAPRTHIRGRALAGGTAVSALLVRALCTGDCTIALEPRPTGPRVHPRTSGPPPRITEAPPRATSRPRDVFAARGGRRSCGAARRGSRTRRTSRTSRGGRARGSCRARGRSRARPPPRRFASRTRGSWGTGAWWRCSVQCVARRSAGVC